MVYKCLRGNSTNILIKIICLLINIKQGYTSGFVKKGIIYSKSSSKTFDIEVHKHKWLKKYKNIVV